MPSLLQTLLTLPLTLPLTVVSYILKTITLTISKVNYILQIPQAPENIAGLTSVNKQNAADYAVRRIVKTLGVEVRLPLHDNVLTTSFASALTFVNNQHSATPTSSSTSTTTTTTVKQTPETLKPHTLITYLYSPLNPRSLRFLKSLLTNLRIHEYMKKENVYLYIGDVSVQPEASIMLEVFDVRMLPVIGVFCIVDEGGGNMLTIPTTASASASATATATATASDGNGNGNGNGNFDGDDQQESLSANQTKTLPQPTTKSIYNPNLFVNDITFPPHLSTSSVTSAIQENEIATFVLQKLTLSLALINGRLGKAGYTRYSDAFERILREDQDREYREVAAQDLRVRLEREKTLKSELKEEEKQIMKLVEKGEIKERKREDEEVRYSIALSVLSSTFPLASSSSSSTNSSKLKLNIRLIFPSGQKHTISLPSTTQIDVLFAYVDLLLHRPDSLTGLGCNLNSADLGIGEKDGKVVEFYLSCSFPKGEIYRSSDSLSQAIFTKEGESGGVVLYVVDLNS